MRANGSLLGLSIAALSWCASIHHASAQSDDAPESAVEEGRVVIVVEGCGGLLSVSDLEGALGIELRGADDTVDGYIRRSRPSARVRCEGGELLIELITDDQVTHREAIPPMRLGIARFVAIAIAESVSARAAAPPPEPTPSPIRAPSPTPAEPPAIAPAPDATPLLRTWIRALGGATAGGEPFAWSGEGLLGCEVVIGGLASIELHVLGGYGAIDVPPGVLEVARGGGGLTLRLVGDLAPFELAGGLGIRAGFVRFEGEPIPDGVRGESAFAPWLGLLATLRAALRLTDWLRLELEVEGGVYPMGARALYNQEVIAQLEPAWLSVRFGLGFGF